MSFEQYKSEYLKSLSNLDNKIEINEKQLVNVNEKDEEPCYTNNESFFNMVSTCRIKKLLSYNICLKITLLLRYVPNVKKT